MSQQQELFNAAVAEYDQMIALLRASASELKKAIPNYSEENLLKSFDTILQGLLLKIGFADSELTNMEIQFIQKLTDHNNILPEDFKVESYEQAEAKHFLDQKADEILSKAGVFLEPLAAVDAALDQVDFYKFICDRIVNISAIFSAMDGNSDNNEKVTAVNAITRYIAEPYQRAVAEFLRNR